MPPKANPGAPPPTPTNPTPNPTDNSKHITWSVPPPSPSPPPSPLTLLPPDPDPTYALLHPHLTAQVTSWLLDDAYMILLHKPAHRWYFAFTRWKVQQEIFDKLVKHIVDKWIWEGHRDLVELFVERGGREALGWEVREEIVEPWMEAQMKGFPKLFAKVDPESLR